MKRMSNSFYVTLILGKTLDDSCRIFFYILQFQYPSIAGDIINIYIFTIAIICYFTEIRPFPTFWHFKRHTVLIMGRIGRDNFISSFLRHYYLPSSMLAKGIFCGRHPHLHQGCARPISNRMLSLHHH